MYLLCISYIKSKNSFKTPANKSRSCYWLFARHGKQLAEAPHCEYLNVFGHNSPGQPEVTNRDDDYMNLPQH